MHTRAPSCSLSLSFSHSVVTSCPIQYSAGFFNLLVCQLCSFLFRPFSILTNGPIMAPLVKVNHFSALLFTIGWQLPLVTLCSNPKEDFVESGLFQKQQESPCPDTKIIFMSVLVSVLLMSH